MRCSALVLAICLAAAVGCGSDGYDGDGDLRVRKDVKDLSAQEKADLIEAILLLKEAPPPAGFETIVVNDEITIRPTNYYALFVGLHVAAVARTAFVQGGEGVAHKNPSFPPLA